MKRLLFTIVYLIVSLTVTAQPKHLDFIGIPIDGTMENFTQAMQQHGFTFLGAENGTGVYMGKFLGCEHCLVGVTTQDNDTVCSVGVMFPESKDWHSLENNYFVLKNYLVKQYGEPAGSIETFNSPEQPQDDENRFYAVLADQCYYFSDFEIDNGSVDLSIEHGETSGCYLLMKYYDKINYEMIEVGPVDQDD